jgi:hypothetical protein
MTDRTKERVNPLPLWADIPTGREPYQDSLRIEGKPIDGEGELQAILLKLIAAARSPSLAARGFPARQYLGDGLTVSVRARPQGGILLQISRNDAFPAMAEWDRVVDALPDGWPQIGPINAGEKDGRYWEAAAFEDWDGQT